MIIDHIQNADLYRPISTRLAMAFDYLTNNDVATIDNGRYDLDGDNVFALVQRYEPKATANIIWESHRKYIDLQYIAVGHERMGHALLHDSDNTAPPTYVQQPYSDENDVTLYDPAHFAHLPLTPYTAGMFAIYYPHDIHAPSLSPTDQAATEQLTKVVIKIAV